MGSKTLQLQDVNFSLIELKVDKAEPQLDDTQSYKIVKTNSEKLVFITEKKCMENLQTKDSLECYFNIYELIFKESSKIQWVSAFYLLKW